MLLEARPKPREIWDRLLVSIIYLYHIYDIYHIYDCTRDILAVHFIIHFIIT